MCPPEQSATDSPEKRRARDPWVAFPRYWLHLGPAGFVYALATNKPLLVPGSVGLTMLMASLARSWNRRQETVAAGEEPVE